MAPASFRIQEEENEGEGSIAATAGAYIVKSGNVWGNKQPKEIYN